MLQSITDHVVLLFYHHCWTHTEYLHEFRNAFIAFEYQPSMLDPINTGYSFFSCKCHPEILRRTWTSQRKIKDKLDETEITIQKFTALKCNFHSLIQTGNPDLSLSSQLRLIVGATKFKSLWIGLRLLSLSSCEHLEYHSSSPYSLVHQMAFGMLHMDSHVNAMN